MNESKMKNMVVLKNLPSNIVEEAYVVLKPNKKLKNIIDIKQEEKSEIMPDYAVREAENVVASYISNMEDNKGIKSNEIEKIKKKYIKFKKLSFVLGIIVILNIFFIFNR